MRSLIADQLKKVKEFNSNSINEMRSVIADQTERVKHDIHEHAEKCRVAFDEHVKKTTDLNNKESKCQGQPFIIRLEDVFTDKEMNNWLKSWLAIGIAKSGLDNFVDKEAQSVHSRIYNTVYSNLPSSTGPCTECFTVNLLKCSTPEICNKTVSCVCQSNHYKPCPMKICDKVCNEIIQEHRFKNVSWNNTSANKWSSDRWEIAKCFLPSEGYKETNTARETDFTGIISYLLNCKQFESKFSFSISPKRPCPPCLLTKARDIGRTVCHSRRCNVTDNALEDIFTTLANLLQDLSSDVDAQTAVAKLQKLLKNELELTTDIISLLNAAHTALKKTDTEQSLEEMNVFVTHCKQETGRKSSNIDEPNNQQSCQNLMDLLKIHYKQTFGHIPISALIESEDEKFSDIYITPNLHLMSQTTLRNTEKQVTKYKDLLVNDDKSYSHIFIQGEAGSGKTTYCAKLVLDWCEPTTKTEYPKKCNSTESRSKNEDLDFNDVHVLKQFKFVFYVALRRSLEQNEITRMIREQLIDLIYASDEDRQQAYALLDTILKTEICLIVLDGLDEWVDHEGKYALPILPISYRECTILITTRHWKLAEGKVKKSKIGKLMELKGVKNPDKVFKNILGRIFKGKQVDEKYSQFYEFTRNKKLRKLFAFPIMLGLIVCSWADGLLREGTQCEIYSLILDCLLKKVTYQDNRATFQTSTFSCFRGTQYLKPNIEVIDVLSKVAFHLLFDEQKEYSLIFTNQQLLKYCVSNEQTLFGLKSGILSEMKQSSRSRLSSLFSFIHKSVQEFLAAYYISSNVNVIDTVINKYCNRDDTERSDTYQVFVFVCGMNTLAANKMSALMAEHDDTPDMHWQFDTYGRITLNTTLQEILLDGYQEAQVHQHTDINLQLSHFVFKHGLFLSETTRNIAALHHIFTSTNSSVVQELVLDIANYGYANAEYRVTILPQPESFKVNRDGRCTICLPFNLSSCHKLKRLYINRTVTVLPGALLGLKLLKELCILCTYKQLDLSAFQQLELLHTSHDVTLIPDSLRSHNKLKQIKVTNVEQECRQNIVRTKFLLDDTDLAQFGSFFPIPYLIESIEMTDIDCSPILLRSLLNAMLDLNRRVNLKIQTKYLGTRTSMTFTANSGYTMEMDTCYSDWSKAIRGLHIKRLNLDVGEKTAGCLNFDVLLLNTIKSLVYLETLRIEMKYFLRTIELPSSLKVLILEYHEVSSSELCCMLEKLYSLNRTMKCWLKIGYLHMHIYYPVTKYHDDLRQRGLLAHVTQYRIHGDTNPDTTDDDSEDYDDGPTFEMVSRNIKHYISMRLQCQR
ncbi:hypothetical protein DPMN_085066 [Dreissena polymorpha]|uniref:NACHT domain-containing protein n=2 Tax=Dreissena polymorpha TaxID=45954 RepID=A0A9D3YBY7_DREPO|nr:hypothetical protein DPMN_085066 [Dreissena polymorpha]